MKRNETFRLLESVCVISAFLTVLFLGGTAAAAADAPLKLKLISMYPKDALWNSFPLKWMDKVNKAAAGKVQISFIGGPEIVAPFEALGPVEKGTFDMVCGTPAFHTGKVPDGYFSAFNKASLPEQRKAGFLKIVDKKYREKANITVIGFCAGGTKLGTLTRKRVATLNDFRSLRIRTVPFFVPVVEALGASPVSISIPETYSALEKGIVDGVWMPIDQTINENGWYRVLKYVIIPTSNFITTDYLMMNAKRFDALPKEHKDLFVETLKAMEPEIWEYYSKATEAELKRAVKEGLEMIHLSPEVAKEYLNRTFEAAWKNLAAKAPDTAAEVSKLFPH